MMILIGPFVPMISLHRTSLGRVLMSSCCLRKRNISMKKETLRSAHSTNSISGSHLFYNYNITQLSLATLLKLGSSVNKKCKIIPLFQKLYGALEWHPWDVECLAAFREHLQRSNIISGECNIPVSFMVFLILTLTSSLHSGTMTRKRKHLQTLQMN